MAEEDESSNLKLPRVHWAAHSLSPESGEYYDDTTREINLALVRHGEIKTQISGSVLTARAGEVLVYPSKTCVREVMSGGTRYLRIFFATGSARFDDTPRVIVLPAGDMMMRWMNDVCDLHEMSDRNRDLTGPLLQAVLARLRQIEQRQATEKTFHTSVALVMKYLEENLAAPVRLTELSRHAHLSAGHLRELFRQQVGSSPLQYQHDLRMQRALLLLEQPHLSLGQIARACGFRDSEYFARRFRHYHHAPPSKLRHRKLKR